MDAPFGIRVKSNTHGLREGSAEKQMHYQLKKKNALN